MVGRVTRTGVLEIVDVHAGGDVGRVIVDGVVEPPGSTTAERAHRLRHEADGLRRLLTRYPHGSPSHCVNLLVAPSTTEADAAAVIMGTMGYPGFSGSNAMCTAAALVETGRHQASGDLRLETPGGVTTLMLGTQSGDLTSVTYAAAPGFALDARSADIPGYGRVPFQLVFGGVFYAVIDAEAVGLDPADAPIPELTRFFEALFTAVVPGLQLTHPELGEMPELTLGLLVGPRNRDGQDRPTVRTAVYMDGGVICRGPTGTGTTALLTWLLEHDEIPNGGGVRAVSPFGLSFAGTTIGTTTVGPHTGVRTRISGRPYLLGRSRVVVDLDDPLLDAEDLPGLSGMLLDR